MSDEKITYSVHNYDPVNKFIDEKAESRTRRVFGLIQNRSLYFS